MPANPSFLSSPSQYSSSLNRSVNRPRFPRPSLKLLFFCNDHPSPMLVSVRAQISNSGSGNISSDPNIDGFASKKLMQSDGNEASSSSSAIDFLTLCRSLKVCLFTSKCWFFCFNFINVFLFCFFIFFLKLDYLVYACCSIAYDHAFFVWLSMCNFLVVVCLWAPHTI